MTTNRYEETWTWREWFELAGCLVTIVALGVLLAAVMLLTVGCYTPPTPKPPTPKTHAIQVQVTPDGALQAATSIVLEVDPPVGQQPPCIVEGVALTCRLAAGVPVPYGAHLRISAPGYRDYAQDFVLEDVPLQGLAPIALQLTAPPEPFDPVLLDKTTLIRTAQENFGGIKLAGCALWNDNLFDPFLLERWMHDRGCFDRMMDEHAVRGDNTVSIDPKAGYHGFNDADLWHDPATFAAFARDIRHHLNYRGEHFRVRVFTSGDDHIPDMRAPGAWEHWQRDVSALAQAAAPYVEFVVPGWEIRHQNDYVSAKRYYDMLAFLNVQFPLAVHSVHLISGSSAPSSWRCDPQIPGSCEKPEDGPPANDADDPARGNEPGAWVYMLDRGLVDEFLYQFEVGGSFIYASTYDQNGDAPPSQWARGAMGRWWDIVVRMGDDPWSAATARAAGSAFAGRRGWRQVPIKAWEFIYDREWDRDPGTVTEQFLNDWCQKALALGGWGCGSASVRRTP